MSPWQSKRLKGPLLVLLSLVGGLALVDSVVIAVGGWNPFGGGQESQTYSRLELASRKGVALAVAQQHGQRLGLVVGMSTSEYGVDLRTLDRLDPGLRWAKITGEHAAFTNMLAVVRRVAEQGVKPERALLCIHYGMLVGAPRAPTSRSDVLRRVLARGEGLNLLGETRRAWALTWLGKNQMAAVNAFETQLGVARERMLGDVMQQRPAAVYAPIDAFEDVPNNRTARGREAWAGRMEVVKQRGWQNPASYSMDNEQVHALQQILPLLGPQLVVVLLPERSVLREVIPEQVARAVLLKAIASAGLAQEPPIWDFRAALPDSEFVDEAHPTGAGRPRLTAAISAALFRSAP